MHPCKESCRSVLKVCVLITERTKESKKHLPDKKRTDARASYAPISVKPGVGGGEGVGGRATHGSLTVAYIPRVGILVGHHAFDLSILCSRREINHLFLLILTILFCPGVGILIIFFRKCQNPHPMPDLPPTPLGLDTDRCISG